VSVFYIVSICGILIFDGSEFRKSKGKNIVKKVTIYTDGACSGNPGPGGWAAILQYKEAVREISGAEEMTTNNRMELMAAIRALELLKEPCSVDLYTDSAYLHRAFEEKWIDRWIGNNWNTSAKKPVENQDLWKKLIELTDRHAVSFNKVKGHSDNPHNNRCDKMAREAIKLLSANENAGGLQQPENSKV